MRATLLLTGLLAACLTSALESPHRKRALLPQRVKRVPPPIKDAVPLEKRQASRFINAATTPYVVDGRGIPLVDFDAGESYAGTLPIDSNSTSGDRLWFWFWPTTNPAANNEIVIWLNGGPGCSSLDGFLQENGPISWQSGTYRPVQNPYSWVNLTNMVWIDQPIGTGFSPAVAGDPAMIKNETTVAAEFAGFWKNFIKLFQMQGYKVYITGESYAGQYIPYIASYMLDQNNTKFYNVKGIQINDPSLNHDDTIIYAPSVGMLNEYSNIFNLNDTFMTHIQNASKVCGYDDFMNNALQFPPAGPIPAAPSSNRPGCGVWDDITLAALEVNPCFNFYHIIDYCPFLWDELGFPSLGTGPNNYFNMPAVQKALNAPKTDYAICGNPTLGLGMGDHSVPSALGPLPGVIERTNNVIIGHGLLDFLLIANGTLVTIQNMTWNGMQGFQTKPAQNNLYVPYHESLGEIINNVFYQGSIPAAQRFTDVAGAGLLGSWHTERGLTFTTVNHAGHEIPQYVPGASYRHLEFLLGRISSLAEVGDYTTQTGDFTGSSPYYRK